MVLVVQLPVLIVQSSSSATEDVSSSPTRGKGDKGRPGTATRKRRERGGENIPKTKRVKQSKGAQGTTKRKRGKVRESSYGGENPASSGQSTTSSKLGEDRSLCGKAAKECNSSSIHILISPVVPF